jgi:histidyl-tRNA synthetase
MMVIVCVINWKGETTMSEFKAVRGMRDFLPKDAEKTRFVEKTARELACLYGYEEVITPVVESYDLLTAKAGEEIRLRMYAFNDLGDRKIALRPEFTASIARLMATKLRTAPKPIRLFCVGSLYRYDEPQFGRFREFWQADYELLGSNAPEADAEVLILTSDLLRKLGLRNHYLKIGHMGILRGILSQEGISEAQQNQTMQLLDKKRWEEALTLVKRLGVSQECLATLKNVFEIKGKEPTSVVKKIMDAVKKYEKAVVAAENLKETLDLATKSNVKLEMLIEAGFARGLEYYTGMIFEAYVPELDFALEGGGRYDRLVELFGGEPTPAVGVAAGIDSMILAMKNQKSTLKPPKERRVLMIPFNLEMKPKVFEVSSMLREAGISVEIEVMERGVSKALSDADRRGFAYAVLIGPEEAKTDKVVLKDLKKREQKTVEIKNLIEEIRAKTR